jgi:hypothetical protein
MIKLKSLLSESSAASSYALKYIDSVHDIDQLMRDDKETSGIIGTEIADPSLYADSETDTKKKQEQIRQAIDSKKAEVFKLLDTIFASVGFKSVSLTYENNMVVVKSAGPDNFQYSEELLTRTQYPLCMLEYSNPTTGNSASYVATHNGWTSTHIIRDHDRTWNYKLYIRENSYTLLYVQKKSGGEWMPLGKDRNSKAYEAVWDKVYGAQFSTATMGTINLPGEKGVWRKRANNLDPNYEYFVFLPGNGGNGSHVKARNIKTKQIFDLDDLAAKNPKYQKTIDTIVKEWPNMVES